MEYAELLAKAPAHDSPEFIEFLRENNEVLWEDEWWLVIKNVKYGWPTAFAKELLPYLSDLEDKYDHLEWKKKPSSEQTVKRFHLHLIER